MTAAQTDRGWYLIHSKPRQESVALANLERQGFRCYLPRVRVIRHRRGRRAARIEPLFPRYLFIELRHTGQNWGPIRSTLGVAALVRFGEHPARVPDELVRYLVNTGDENDIHQLPNPGLQPGDPVAVIDGVFAGFEGIFDAPSGRDRVTVLLDIIGRSVPVTLHGDQIIRA